MAGGGRTPGERSNSVAYCKLWFGAEEHLIKNQILYLPVKYGLGMKNC